MRVTHAGLDEITGAMMMMIIIIIIIIEESMAALADG